MSAAKIVVSLILIALSMIPFLSCNHDNSTVSSPTIEPTVNLTNIQNEAISEFWNVFLAQQYELASIQSANRPVYDTILEKLQKINPELYFEYSCRPGNNIIIITAEGNISLFPLADFVVAQAPEIPNWTVFSLRPKEGFPATATWDNFTVKIADVVFRPLEIKGSNELGLEILVPRLKQIDIVKCHNALLRAIDHGIGERKFAESVLGTKVVPLPDNADISKYYRLVDLESYILERERKLSK